MYKYSVHTVHSLRCFADTSRAGVERGGAGFGRQADRGRDTSRAGVERGGKTTVNVARSMLIHLVQEWNGEEVLLDYPRRLLPDTSRAGVERGGKLTAVFLVHKRIHLVQEWNGEESWSGCKGVVNRYISHIDETSRPAVWFVSMKKGRARIASSLAYYLQQ